MGTFGACPECGQVIARDLTRCPYCRTELAPGTVPEGAAGAERREWEPRPRRAEPALAPMPAVTAELAELPPPPAPPAPPGRPERYRPTASLGLALQLMFAAWMALGGLVAAARFVEWRLASELVSNPFAVSYDQAVAADDRSFRLGLVVIAAYAVTGILFIAWLRRSYRNVTSFTGTAARFTEGWAIGAWFVPILNLFRPKQIVDECWSDSGPRQDPGVPYEFRAGARVPAVLNLWWGLMIAGRVFGSAFWFGSPDDPEQLRFWTTWLAIGAVVEIAAAAAAFWVVTLLTRRQRRRAASLGFERGPRPVPRTAAALLVAALPLGAAAAAVPSFLAWDQPAAFETIQGQRDGGLRHYDNFGVAFDYPAEYTAAEGSGTGSGAATELFGAVALAAPGGDESLIVQWLPSWGTESLEDSVDLVIDGIASGPEEPPLLHTSALDEIPFGEGAFVYRTFDLTAEGETMFGAVGFAYCPSGDRVIGVYTMRLVGSGAVVEALQAVLATLSC